MLGFFGGFRNPPASWMYPTQMRKSVEAIPPGSVAVLETDELLRPRSRYPADLVAALADEKSYTLAARSAGGRPAFPGESVLWSISGRNAPVGWVAYRKK